MTQIGSQMELEFWDFENHLNTAIENHEHQGLGWRFDKNNSRSLQLYKTVHCLSWLRTIMSKIVFTEQKQTLKI